MVIVIGQVTKFQDDPAVARYIWNGDVLKTWSVRQKTIALSSAEAELYAMTKCVTQTLGMIQLMQDFNIVLKGVSFIRTLLQHWESCLESELDELGIYRYKLVENDLRAVEIGGKFNLSGFMTKCSKRKDIDNKLHIMVMQVHDSQSRTASIQHKSFNTGEGVDCRIRIQKEQWPGSDVDKPQVTELWREIVKEHHDKLKNEVSH